MSDIALTQVSDVLDDFDLTEVAELIRAQIEVEDSDMYTGIRTDHFKPVYLAYKKLIEDDDADEDDINEAKDRFYNICSIIIALIEKHYGFTISDSYLDSHGKNIPAVTMAIYDFFVIDFYKNMEEFLQNYIIKNIKTIVSTFNDLKHRKDTATTANRKTLSPEMTIVGSNIYDIIDWILDSVDEEGFMNTMDPGYLALTIIQTLYDAGNCEGEFVKAFHRIYKSSLSLKAQLGYDILYKIKNGEIEDLYPKNGSGSDEET